MAIIAREFLAADAEQFGTADGAEGGHHDRVRLDGVQRLVRGAGEEADALRRQRIVRQMAEIPGGGRAG